MWFIAAENDDFRTLQAMAQLADHYVEARMCIEQEGESPTTR